ncbi:thermonuclease family protein [Rhizobium ruizarguesonis]|nr:thermonuclease family protein [Rhizobium ruizarguesonis]
MAWATPSTATATVTEQFTVTDGDTVHVIGEATGTRLVGYNTPEKFTPQCTIEQQLGERASNRLRELVAGGAANLTKVACACQPGTEGTGRCNHGRSCGTLLVDGEDVGSILIREGLAVPFVCNGTRCPPTPRPWCAGWRFRVLADRFVFVINRVTISTLTFLLRGRLLAGG